MNGDALASLVQSKIPALGLSLLIDGMLGEPPMKLHLTALSGNMIEFLERRLNHGDWRRFKGSVAAVLTVLTFTLTILFLLTTLRVVSPILHLFFSAFVLKSTFAVKSMDQHIKPISKALQRGNLPEARGLLSRVSRRDASHLDERLISSGAVEAVAEGTVDGLISPLFFYFILGVPGAVMFRVVNTLDSMIGYRDERYGEFGWLSAKLDTILNFAPARFTSLLILLTGFKGLKRNLSFLMGNKRSTSSVNAGWPLAAMAARLKVKLEKKGHYIIGGEFKSPCWKDVDAALKVMKASAAWFVAVSLLIDLLIRKTEAFIGAESLVL
ncbi:MAG: cobalamin biosynthesis protein [Candidatus Bathyarchaeia archaeon]